MVRIINMKTLNVFFLLMSISIATWAQDTDFQDRDFSLKVVDNKGRPLNKIIVQSLHTGMSGITDRSGLFVFREISDSDTISLRLPKYGPTLIPVAGLDSIVVTLRSRRLYSYIGQDGQSLSVGKDRIEPNSTLDVQALLVQRSYDSLVALLQEHFVGLNLRSTGSGDVTANIRGPGSPFSSSEPLVVLNGTPWGTINQANTILDVNNIKSIEVQKGASEWGMQGANGVILITTK